MLELTGLERRYDGAGGVTDISVTIPHGAVYVLCGANGAGKTTTISVLSGLLFASRGRMRFTGTDGSAREIRLDRYDSRDGFGYVADQPLLDTALTPWQWLAYASAIKQAPVRAEAARELAEGLALAPDTLDTTIGTLSFGNQRKVELWVEMATTRDLLVLDEPLNGLDPIAIRAFHTSAAEFVRTGRSILLSTHLLAEAETLATHVGFINRGRTVQEGEVAEVCRGGSLRDAFLRAAA